VAFPFASQIEVDTGEEMIAGGVQGTAVSVSLSRFMQLELEL
jgi:hypothetical protein